MLPYVFMFHISFTERKYSKLCGLCNSKRGCSQYLHAYGNQNAALDCLTKKDGGHVAYVGRYYVKEHFNVSHLNFYFFINMASLGKYFKMGGKIRLYKLLQKTAK